MASFKQYTASGGASEAFSIPTFSSDEIKVYVDGVLKTAATHYNITSYTANGGTVTWTGGNVPSSGTVRIVRDTTVTTARATYAAGSSIKAGDLNDNQTQALRSLEEQDDQLIQTYDVQDAAVTTAKIKADNITSALIADDQINSEHYVDGSIDTAHIADAQVTTAKIADSNVTTAKIADANVTTAKIADNAVTLAKLNSGALPTDITVASANLVDGTVATADIANDAITNAKIADDSIDSEHYVDGSIDTAHLADNSVTGAKLAAGTIGTTDLADSGVTTAKIADNNITTAKIAADAVTGAKIADDAVSTEHYAAGSVNNAAIGTNAVNSDQIAADAVTTAKIANDAITSAKIATGAIQTVDISNNTIVEALISDGEVTTAKIANDAITSSKIANDQIDSNHYVDGSIDTAHIGATQVTDAKLASNAVTTSKITDANVTTVKVADSNITLAKLASDLKQTSISNSDTQLPTSGAVVDYVAAQIAPIGGLEVIATDAAFPNTQPAAGVVISIADAGGLVVNGSGTSTTGRTVGASTVTINNIASNFNSTTVDAGVSFMVSSTGSGQIYNYHKATLKEADLLSLSGDINDFAERYRVAGSAPSSSLDDGDLWWDTATDKLKVYDGSSWEEVASSGDFYINTISSYSGTGGNSASFNGSAYRFVLSNPGSTAQQHVVSINGVIQKPNSGTSQPSEGFVIDGSSIILSNAPASGADYFILTLGTTVSIGTPSDNTVATAKIQNLAVTTAKIAADAVDGTKIADDAVGAEHIEVLDAALQFGDSVKAQLGTGNDLELWHQTGNSYITSTGANLTLRAAGHIYIEDIDGNNMADFNDGGAVELSYDGTKKFETTSEGILVSNSSSPATFKITDTSGSGYEGYIQMRGNDMEIRGSSGQLEFYTGSEDGSSSTLRGRFTAGGNFQINNDAGKIELGTSQDLKLYHDGNDSYISDTGTGDLYLSSNKLKVNNGANDETLAIFNENGAVELNYDNSKKFETTSAGGTLTGALTVTNEINLFNGTTDASRYVDAGLGDSNSLVLRGCSGGDANHETLAEFTRGGGVKLYYDNVKKFETTSNGTHMYGTTYVESGFRPASYGGASLGSSSYRWYDLRISNTIDLVDNGVIQLGDGQDLRMYHNGTNSIIKNNTGYLQIMANNAELVNNANSEYKARFLDNAAVELYYDGARKLETMSNGIGLDGDSSSCAIRLKSDGSLRGYFYADANSSTGHLNNSGGWKFRIENDGDYQFYGSSISDKDLKDNITTVSDTSLDKITKLVPKTYKWKNLDGITPTDKTFTGFIAQEVKEHLPSLVTGTDGQKNMAVDYNGILAYAVKAITELSAEVETLKTKVAALEAK